MKNRIFIFLAILLFLFPFKAQAQWSLTPQVGVNSSNLLVTTLLGHMSEDFSTSVLPVWGITTQYQFHKKWAVSLAFQHSGKGYKLQANPEDKNSIYYRAKSNYYDFLPTLSFAPLPFFSIYSGANIGFASKKYFKLYYGNRKEGYINLDDKVDIGALLGFRFNIKNITINLHYNQSLFELDEAVFSDESCSDLGLKRYYQVIQMTLGYQLDLKRKKDDLQ